MRRGQWLRAGRVLCRRTAIRSGTKCLACVAGLSVLLFFAGVSRPAAEEATSPVLESKFELFVSDGVESAAFYEVLGFAVVHQKSDGYTTLRSGSTVLALSPLPSWLPIHWFGFLRHPPLGTEIVFYTRRLEALRIALMRAGYAPCEIKLQSWGDRDFRVSDPDGYYVRIFIEKFKRDVFFEE
ncbi:MAG: hypothetical protein ABGX04_10765 [Myxococcales bacterium]|nr:hypothetical protein [Myxococcales bacterium]HIK84249.1 hypothetical protein [Myxococcales bacterium]